MNFQNVSGLNFWGVSFIRLRITAVTTAAPHRKAASSLTLNSEFGLCLMSSGGAKAVQAESACGHILNGNRSVQLLYGEQTDMTKETGRKAAVQTRESVELGWSRGSGWI